MKRIIVGNSSKDSVLQQIDELQTQFGVDLLEEELHTIVMLYYYIVRDKYNGSLDDFPE